MADLNININDGEAFFAHELSINFNPTQMFLDFKCITPRVDPRSKDHPTIHIKHNVISLDLFHAKQVYELLGKVLGKYEKEFGIIEIPKPLELAQSKQQEQQKSEDVTKQAPTYFG